MHEHSFIEAILGNIEDIDNVKSVELEIGDLAGIEANHLKEHMLEKVDFEISVSTKKGKVLCECGYEGKPVIRERLHDLVIFDCPKCGEIPEVLEGKDIKIVKVVYN